MRTSFPLTGAAALALIGSTGSAAYAASFASTIRLQVPVICELVRHGDMIHKGNEYRLGQLHEYCNAPGGFLLEVEYQPGRLRGAVLQAGADRVTLDGSGHTQIMRSGGPKISTVDVVAIAGPDELDGGSLQFHIVPLS